MRKFQLLVLSTLLLAITVVLAAEPVGISNNIKWATASELSNFGFDVFRGDTEDGTFEKINEHTIPGAGNSDTPSRYQFADTTIEAGKAYWYYVESISMSSQREKFTPTFQSKPKFPEAAD
jgi:hypothetical protein